MTKREPMKRACGCCDIETPEPRLIYSTREGAVVRRRLHHLECGKKWWQHETLHGEETACHVDP